MRFNLVDRILKLEAGRSIHTVKYLTSGEEYLADHFPTFPVLPGVLMLQALVESGAWLLRLTHDFRHSVIVLHEARGVKFGKFIEPGRRMDITVDLVEENGSLANFKARGELEGQTALSARLTLRCSNLAERNPEWKTVDEGIVRHLRSHFRTLSGMMQLGAN
jgi:3-hydroxyacyl-[acyl-carrier-protein] dehydratase